METRRGRFANVSDSLLATTKGGLLYEARSSGCNLQGYPDEYTLTRIVYAKHNAFVLTYTCRALPILDAKRDD